MKTPSFRRRSPELELLDKEDASCERLRGTFRELGLINRGLGGHRATMDALDSLTPSGARRLKLLDVGCSDGQAASLMLDWAQSRGIAAEILGIDLSAAAVRLAEEHIRPGLHFFQQDLLLLPPGESFDIVHAGLMLHHCPGESAALALKAMYERSRLGIIVNDLHRHPLAYHGIRLLTGALSRDPFIRHDAPLSVLRGFQRQELVDLCSQAGLPAPEIRWRWAFRWQMVVRR